MESQQAAFMGKITAGVTHEFKNVLAIIKESSGLMGDLLEMCEKDKFPYGDRFANALCVIQGQIDRGVELASRLNRFAHSPDEPRVTIDLNEVAEQIVFLSRRFAGLKGVTLRTESADRVSPVVTNLLQLEMVLFLSLECCWEQVESGGGVSVGATSHEGMGAIRFICEGVPSDAPTFVQGLKASQGWARLQDITRTLGAKTEMDESARALLLILPGP